MKTLLFALVLVSATYFSEAKTLNRREIVTYDALSQVELLAKLAGMMSKSNSAIALLEKEGKPLLAAGIKKIDDVLIGLQKKVESANPNNEVGRLALKGLDELIIVAEHELEAELKKIEGPTTLVRVFKRDVLDDINQKLASLLTKNKDAQALLIKEGKAGEAAGLQALENEIKSIETKVKQQDPHSTLGKIALFLEEQGLALLEQKMDDEIKKLTGPTALVRVFKRDANDDLLAKLAAMLTKSKDAQALLVKEGKAGEAAALQALDKKVIEMETKIKSEPAPTTLLGKLGRWAEEEALQLIEHEMENEIKKLTGPTTLVRVFKRAADDDLVTKIAKMITKSETAQHLLEAAGKGPLAAGLKALEAEAAVLQAKAEKSEKGVLGVIERIAIEAAVNELDKKLDAEIAKLQAF